MLVFEYQCKLKFLKSINHKTIAEKINYFLDSVLAKDQEFLQYHENKGYKYYVTDAPWPIEKDGIYKEGKVYTLRIRTVKQELAEFFSEKLYAHTSKELLGIGGKLRIIPKKHIEELYSITPIVVKTDEGYWRGNMTVPEFEKIIKINLIKKYKQFTGQNISEDILLYDVMKFNNRVPIKVSIIEVQEIRDVFTGQPVKKKKYDIDHFIPWSFVMNDELWNLMPMDASLNSSKSNRLPKWNPFFQNFAQNQYLMYQMIYDDMGIYKRFKGCYKDNLHSIWAGQELYRKGNSKEMFYNILEKNIIPVYDSARRQGYEIWDYS